MPARCIFVLFTLTIAGFAQNRAKEFAKLADRLFEDVIFRFDPVQGTAAGFHQYDARFASGSRAEIDAHIAALREFESKVRSFDPRGLTPWFAADRELAPAQIRGQLLSLETICSWEQKSGHLLIQRRKRDFRYHGRKFAPPADRLGSVTARERLPGVYASNSSVGAGALSIAVTPELGTLSSAAFGLATVCALNAWRFRNKSHRRV